MKTNAIIRIIIWSIVIAVLVGILCTIHAFNLYTENFAVKGELTLEETPMHRVPNETNVSIAADQVQELEIDWAAGTILIQPADVEEITFYESDVPDEDHAMLWQHKNGKLTIQFSEDGAFNFNFGITVNVDISKDLTILVPGDFALESLEIDAAAATVEVHDMTIGDVEFDGASGACEFDNCSVDTLDIDTASGDVVFTGNLNILDCDAASASIVANLNNTPSRMDLDTMSGDLDISLPANCGFTVSMDGMDSDFTSDFETTIKNNNYIYGDGRCHIDVNAMSGDLTIRNNG